MSASQSPAEVGRAAAPASAGPTCPAGGKGQPGQDILTVTFPFEPVAKGRPRLDAKGRTYTPKTTRVAEANAQVLLRTAMRGRQLFTGDVAVVLRFRCRTRRRKDLDNLIKLVLDACNGVVFADDAQVVALTAVVERGSSRVGTDVYVDPEAAVSP